MRVPHRLRARSPRRVAAQVRLRAGRPRVARSHARLDQVPKERPRLDVVRGPRPEKSLRVQFVKAPSLDDGPGVGLGAVPVAVYLVEQPACISIRARASFLAARHRVFSSGPVFCVSERVSSRKLTASGAVLCSRFLQNRF